MKISSLLASLCCAALLTSPAGPALGDEKPVHVFQEALELQAQSQQAAWRIGGMSVVEKRTGITIDWDLGSATAHIVDTETEYDAILQNDDHIYTPIPARNSRLNQRALYFLGADQATHFRSRQYSGHDFVAVLLALSLWPNPVFLPNRPTNDLPTEAERISLDDDAVRYTFHYVEPFPYYLPIPPETDLEPIDLPAETAKQVMEFREGMLTRLVIRSGGFRLKMSMDYRPITVIPPTRDRWVTEYNLASARSWLAGARDTKKSARAVKELAKSEFARSAVTPIEAIYRVVWQVPQCQRVSCFPLALDRGVKIMATSKFGKNWASVTWQESQGKFVIRTGRRENLANAPQPSDTATTAATASAESQQITKKGGSS